MSFKRKLILNVGSNWANMVASAISQIVLVPVILSSLGVEKYGVWALLAYGLAYPMIFERAFALAINRFVAFYRDDKLKLNSFISASFLIMSGLGVLTVVLAFILSFFVSRMFNAIPANLAYDAKITCTLVGLTIGLQMIRSCFGGALAGFQYYTRCNTVLVLTHILRVCTVVGMLFFWKSIIAIQLAYVIVTLISAVVMYVVTKYSFEGMKLRFSGIELKIFKEIWKYTSHSMARSGSTIVMFNTLTLLVGWKGSASDVMVYDVTFKLPSIIRGLLGGMQNVFLPIVTSLHAKGQEISIGKVIKKMTRISVGLTFILSILLFAFTKDILGFWLKKAITPDMVFVMRVFILSLVPDGCFGIWLPSLVGMGHLRGLTIGSVLSCIGAVSLGVIFIDNFSHVHLAPAISLTIAMWAYRGIWLPLYGVNKLKLQAIDYLSGSLVRPIISSIISIAIFSILGKYLLHYDIGFILRGIVYSIVLVIVFALISFKEESKELFVALKTRFQVEKER